MKKLVKPDVSPESLRKYHGQGWHFFIRTVAKKKYITIRRRGKERSLGPYSDEVWRVIEGIDNRRTKLGKQTEIQKDQENQLYVDARGGQKGKGLGPLSDEFITTIEYLTSSLYNKLESQKELTQTRRVFDETDDPLTKMFEEINRSIGRHKCINCLHVGADGFCGYWRLEELPEHGKQLNQKESEYVFKKVNQDDGKTEVWALRPFPIICHDCPAFVDDKMIDFFSSRNKG